MNEDNQNSVKEASLNEAATGSEEPTANTLQDFPTDALPERLRSIIKELGDALDYPSEFTATAILYATSIAVGNTYRVKIKGGFHQKPVLYVAIVGPPGSNKTHPLTFALSPLKKRDRASFREYKDEADKFDAARNKNKNDRTEEEKEIAEGPEPEHSKFLVQDVTLEALQKVHDNNPRGIGLFMDELAGFFENFSRYSGGSDQPFYLSNWSGQEASKDRAGSRPIYIAEPFISIGGTIQTRILDRLAADRRSDNGFLDRFLFAIRTDKESPVPSDNELPEGIHEEWDRILGDITSIPMEKDRNGFPSPRTMEFDEQAHYILQDRRRKLTERRNALESEALQGVLDKFDQHLPRIALILQILKSASISRDEGKTVIDADEEITEDTLREAIRITEFFIQHALKVHEILNSKGDPLELLDEKWKKFFEALPDEPFEKKDAEDVGTKMSIPIPERTVRDFLRRHTANGKGQLFRKTARNCYSKAI